VTRISRVARVCQRQLGFLVANGVAFLQFTQHEDKKQELLKTAGTKLVYTDPYDTLLGIGLHMDSPDACKRDKWYGKNLLGEVLTNIRDDLLLELQVCSNCIAVM